LAGGRLRPEARTIADPGKLVPFLRPMAAAGDALFELQLRIARRADELARRHQAGSPPAPRPASGASLNLHCWLLAEAEILGGALAAQGSTAGAARGLAAVGGSAPEAPARESPGLSAGWS